MKSEAGALACVTSDHRGGLWLPVRQTAVRSMAVRKGKVEKCLALLLLVLTENSFVKILYKECHKN